MHFLFLLDLKWSMLLPTSTQIFIKAYVSINVIWALTFFVEEDQK